MCTFHTGWYINLVVLHKVDLRRVALIELAAVSSDGILDRSCMIKLKAGNSYYVCHKQSQLEARNKHWIYFACEVVLTVAL